MKGRSSTRQTVKALTQRSIRDHVTSEWLLLVHVFMLPDIGV